MGWINVKASGSTETATKTSNESMYGTRTPTMSEDWLAAFKRTQNNLNSSGYTPDQQKAVDMVLGGLNKTQGAVTTANSALAGLNPTMQGAADQWQSLYWQPAPTASMGTTAGASEDYVGDISAKTGSQYMDQYSNPWDKQVIDASVADYNTNTDRTLNGMRASRDASGAFGDRSAIADAVYQADATRGLGSLVSGLRQTGFNTAAGYGMQDANRTLLADQSNQATKQAARGRNAGLLASANALNANNFTDVSKFNASALLQSNNQRAQALEGLQNNLKAQAGLSQQALDNIFKGNEIDTNAAQGLFAAGQISQEQLNTILQAAQAGNGFTYSQDTTGNSSSNTKKLGFETGIG